MTTQYAIEGNNITKNLKGFNLDIDDLKVPKGFATALIGENGAGKTTLLNILRNSFIRKSTISLLSKF